ncbi:MAG: ferrous iron transporter B [Deltaproteobacteria bacterium]|nr:ferrous iron transporter B [Deltaproteobacteria bacterium]
MVARSNQGIRNLMDRVVEVAQEDPEWHMAAISYGMDIDGALDEISALIDKSEVFDPKYPTRWRALKCLEGDSQIKGLLNRDPALGKKIKAKCDAVFKHTMSTLEEEPESIIADHRYGYITGITKQVIKRKIQSRLNVSDKIDMVLTNRAVGPVIMIAILYALYAVTFWASEVPIELFERFFDVLKEAVSNLLPEGLLQSMVISGIIDGVGGVLGFVPLIMLMFFCIAIMEDSGYMARIAYMLDRVLRWFGLHGNSVMALVVSGGLSGGCAVPGVMATRVLKDPKERIATLLVIPFMNCGAKLPVYAMLIGAFFARDRARVMFLLTLLSWGFALFAAKFIRSTILRGPKTPFVMELPPYRVPTLRGLLIHTWERTWDYIKKAGTIILAFSVLLWAMMTFPRLPEGEKSVFDGAQKDAREAFLSSPDVSGLISGKTRIAELDRIYGALSGPKVFQDVAAQPKDLIRIAKAAIEIKEGRTGRRGAEDPYMKAGKQFLDLKKRLNRINGQEQQAALKGTVAGRMGRWLETITGPLGFEYRTNIALVGGFAAKEVVVSTLGTAYSLGAPDPEETGSLSKRLKQDPEWNPLQAFTLIVFTMLYVPCIATVISIRRETSWRWALFSILFNLVVAYMVALVIRQGGMALGLGLG